MWDTLAVGAIGLAGVVVGQRMSRGAAQETLHLQIEEQRRLEVRRLLVRLLVDVRAQLDLALILLPMFTRFQYRDYEEFVETDSGREMGARAKRTEEDVTALGLLVPDGPLRVALHRLEAAAVRDWSAKAVGPAQDKKPRADGREPLEVAFGHVRECRQALGDVQREAALHLAVPPVSRPTVADRARSAWTQLRTARRPN